MPATLVKWVSRRPSLRAFAFIQRTNVPVSPAVRMARVAAQSWALLIIRPSRAWRIVMRSPGLSPIPLLAATLGGATSRRERSGLRSMTMSAVMILVRDAGWRSRWMFLP